jgi:hypothetical protein
MFLLQLIIKAKQSKAKENLPGVPTGNVGRETANLAGGSGARVGAGELLGSRGQVGVPAEPAAVAGVDVHDDVVEVELRQGVGDALAVARGRGLAGGEVGVGHQVGQGVGLNDEGKGRVGVGLEDGDDGCVGG